MKLSSIIYQITIFIYVISFSIPCYSQHVYDFNNYEGLRSEGPIPSDFLTSWSEKAKVKFDKSLKGNEDEGEKEKLEQFWVASHYILRDMLSNGTVSFGDPVTNYLNKIKDIILADDPKLAKEIRIYTMKSPIVNAFCTFDGIIFVNTGLIARVKTEAELAFVISHEICHFTESHSLENYYQRLRMLEDEDEFEDLSRIEKVNFLIKRSKNDEFEADEQGLNLFLNSNYSLNGVDGTLDFLQGSYLPFVENEISRQFLSTPKFSLPDVFFLDSLKPISFEEDYFDETHSHPNIHKRRTALDELMKIKSPKGDRKRFIQSENLFNEIKILSRFESVRQEVKNGFYGDAIYHIEYLKKEYPKSKFLDMSMAKSLYGLACYKAINKYKAVARSFNKQEGESQQLHYVLRQFNRKQLVSLVLYHILEMQKKYPEEKALQVYIDQLTMHMLVHCGLKVEDFELENSKLKDFDKPSTDFKSDRAFLRAKQRHYKDFYKYLLQDQYRSNWLKENLEKHQYVVDSIASEQTMAAKQKKRRAKAKRKVLKNKGTGLNISKLLILDPRYIAIGNEDMDDYDKAVELEAGLKKKVLAISAQEGVNALPLYTAQMGAEDVKKYNDFAELKVVMAEARTFYRLHLKPPSLDNLIDLQKDLSIRYVCMVGGVILIEEHESWYFISIYDLQQGKMVYQRKEDLNRKISLEELEEEFRLDIQRLKN